MASVPENEIAAAQEARAAAEKARRERERVEGRIIGMKMAVAREEHPKYAADIYSELKGGRAVPRLRIGERRPGEGGESVQ